MKRRRGIDSSFSTGLVAWHRRWLRLGLAVVLMPMLLIGCGDKTNTANKADPNSQATNSDDAATTDLVKVAKQLMHDGKLDAAAEAAYKALVQTPDNPDAILIASELEAARSNHQASADLASEIDLKSPYGERATEIRWQQFAQLGRFSEAADAILAGLTVKPNKWTWRHQAWAFLNQVGRRQEASRQADVLCYVGQATPNELVSLLRRNDAFPFTLPDGKDVHEHFQRGLGISKWLFTQRESHDALDQLAEQFDSGFQNDATCAFYGRLLAETQSHEQFPAWHAKCDKNTAQFSDYWCALGTYFFDQHEFEASARALMEAVFRDPTDDFTVHRLARVFDALGRPDDAEQFRHRAILVAKTEQYAEQIAKSQPTSDSVRKSLPRKLMELGRPFESLGWTLVNLPPNAAAARAEVAHQLAALVRNKEAVAMASQMALVDLNPADFSLSHAMEKLVQSSPSAPSTLTARDIKTLATPRLVNVADEVGLAFQWYQDTEINVASIPIHEVMGGGIAVVDFDLDGWPDVYLGQGSGDPPSDACTRTSMLFRNVDGTNFLPVTELALATDFNYSTGIAAGDINQDGFCDLFLGALGRNRLLVNNGDGTFRDATEQLGNIDDQFTSSLAIADINGDHLPDLFEAVYLTMKGGFKLPDVGSDGRPLQPSPLSFYAQSDRWFENSGDGSFRVKKIDDDGASPGTSLGILVADFDSDSKNEVFVGNDGRANHFLVQTGDDSLRNTADLKGLASGFGGEANACMGIAAGDFNRDGTLDMHITNFLKESANHYLQSSTGGFTDYASRYKIDSATVPFVGFGTKAIDVDRNGLLDLLVSNGHVFDRRDKGEPLQMPPQMLMSQMSVSQGGHFQPVQVEDSSGYWGSGHLGRAVATLDMNRDGSVDFLVGHMDQPLALLRNETSSPGHWLQLELIGSVSERDAIGARIVVQLGNETLSHWVIAGDGYLCSDEPVLDLGLGGLNKVDQLQVHWPSGKIQSFEVPAVDHRYLVIEGCTHVHLR